MADYVIVGRLGPPPERKPDRLMTAREVEREQNFRAWVNAGRPGAGKKKRLAAARARGIAAGGRRRRS